MTPYIHFQGNCREAMTAYQSIFGGKLDVMVYGDMPGGEPRHVGSTAVMHSALMTDEVGDLQGSDFPPGVEGDAQKAISISIQLANVERAKEVNDALLEGGAVAVPFGPTFFSPGFGMLRDRFGTHWIIMSAPQE